MTVVKAIQCNSCYDVTTASYGFVDTAGARHHAQQMGWHKHEGKDYCPTCWERRVF